MHGSNAPTIEPASEADLTPYAHDRQPTPTEIADAQKYSEWRTKVTLTDETTVYFTDHDTNPSRAYRFAGRLEAHPAAREFRVTMFDGATAGDLAFIEAEIEQIRRGGFDQIPWTAHHADGPAWWSVRLGRAVDRDELRGPREPWTPDAHDPLVACDDPDCASYRSVHGEMLAGDDVEPVLHVHDTIEGRAWRIVIWRGLGESRWQIEVTVEEGISTADDAASMASDLQWAGAQVRRLNG